MIHICLLTLRYDSVARTTLLEQNLHDPKDVRAIEVRLNFRWAHLSEGHFSDVAAKMYMGRKPITRIYIFIRIRRRHIISLEIHLISSLGIEYSTTRENIPNALCAQRRPRWECETLESGHIFRCSIWEHSRSQCLLKRTMRTDQTEYSFHWERHAIKYIFTRYPVS